MQQIFQFLPLIGLYLLVMTVLYIYKFFSTKDALRAWYKKRLIIEGLSLLGFIVLWFFAITSNSMLGVAQGGSVSAPMMANNYSTKSSGKMMPTFYQNNYNNYGNTNGNISDTREFIKKSFNATLKTREVENTAKKVEVLIKGMDGRIDGSNISTQYGYFTFVIPKNKMNEFEAQLRTYTNAKFYSQNVSSQNLLGDKQNLERNQNTTVGTISSLTAQQKQLSDEYTKNSNALGKEISTKKSELTATLSNIFRVRTDLANATDTILRANLTNELNSLRQREQSSNQSISVLLSNSKNLTNTFKAQMSNLGYSLDQQNSTLANLGIQENNFLDNIETVNGTVSINYISVWEILDLYSPINPFIILIIAFFAIRMFFLFRKEKELALLTVTS